MASKIPTLTFRLTPSAKRGLVSLGRGSTPSDQTEFYVSLGSGVRDFLLIWAKPTEDRTPGEQRFFSQLAAEIIAVIEAADEEGEPVSLQFE